VFICIVVVKVFLMTKTHPDLKSLSRALRRRQTDVERILWGHLRSRRFQGFRFRRQQPIERYIVDFCCFENRLIIELDGGQHNVNKEKDEVRTRVLEDNGFRVLRFWDSEVIQELEAVLTRILKALGTENPSPRPLPQGERGRQSKVVRLGSIGGTMGDRRGHGKPPSPRPLPQGERGK